MKQYEILFNYETLNDENSFFKEKIHFLTKALITEKNNANIDIFHVKLLDIGLDSKLGEFEIIRKNGFCLTDDRDGRELNLVKSSIFTILELQNK